MAHPRVEEVSDSDPEIEDPTSYIPPSGNQTLLSPSQIPTSSTSRPLHAPSSTMQPTRESIKHYISIYPVYFDRSRTRSNGRRVSRSLSTANPLAYNIAQSLPSILGPQSPLPTVFEPDKTHPKDWSNPGRVRVGLFEKSTHRPLHPEIRTKCHLFVLVARYLQDHPTRLTDATRVKIPGLPVPEAGYGEPMAAVPRGWKVNAILPVHSDAVSGGGVSGNFFKEAMEELRQAQLEHQHQQGQGQGKK